MLIWIKQGKCRKETQILEHESNSLKGTSLDSLKEVKLKF